jgi:hypothetical protein
VARFIDNRYPWKDEFESRYFQRTEGLAEKNHRQHQHRAQAPQPDLVGFDATGRMNLDTGNPGWRPTWDIIVAGNFIRNGLNQILLYDRGGGSADRFDNTGRMNLDTGNPGWRTTWDIIVAGNFIGNGLNQILLYDRSSGSADLVGFDATGRMNLDTGNPGWRTTWETIVAGNFVGNRPDQILLYDRGR